MLHLYHSRAKLVRIVFGGVMVLVSLSMLAYLIPSYGSGEATTRTVLARIGSVSLTRREVLRVVRNSGRATGMPSKMVSRMVFGRGPGRNHESGAGIRSAAPRF